MAFAVPTLRALNADRRLALVLAGTPAARRAGRGLKLRPSPFAAACAELGLDCASFAKADELDRALAGATVDFAVVCAFGMKLSPAALAAPRRGCINIHASLLPRWRGAAPIERAILAGDAATGVSLIQMTERMDQGPLLASASIPLEAAATAGMLHARLAELGAKLIVPALLDHAKLAPVPQDEGLATAAPKLGKDEARLDWAADAELLQRQVRAFNPRPGAYMLFRGRRVKVLAAKVADGAGEPGSVLAVGRDLLRVACGKGSLELVELVPAGSRPMTVAAWLAGLRQKPGRDRPLDG